MIPRRSFLATGAAWCLAPKQARSSSGPEVPPRPPPPQRNGSRLDRIAGALPPWLDLDCRHTGETWQGWFAGQAELWARAELEWFLRDWRESVCVAICPRIYWALAAAAHQARIMGADGKVTVLSGYRTPRTNASLPGAARNSFHMYGRAIDIRVNGFTTDDLAGYMRQLEVGGVGRYPVSSFVHIDSGRIRDWTGKG